MNWVPRRKIGAFEFGADISVYCDEHSLELVPEEYSESVNWEVYRPKAGNFRLYVEEGRIAQMACFESLLLNNVELLGLSIREVQQILGTEPNHDGTIEVIDEIEQVYEFDEVEAQFWVKDDRVVAVFCGPSQEESA